METKHAMILRILGERSLNRFEAERVGDHCLHTTVSTLRGKGHEIHSTWEKVPTRFGREVRVKRYRLIRLAGMQC